MCEAMRSPARPVGRSTSRAHGSQPATQHVGSLARIKSSIAQLGRRVRAKPQHKPVVASPAKRNSRLLSWGRLRPSLSSLLVVSTTLCCAAGVDNGAAEPADSSETDASASSFTVLPVAGDGRCMFRSIVLGIWRASGQEGTRPATQVETNLADHLRQIAVLEMKARREEIEWALEEDFDTYTAKMSGVSAWGGEPELLMLSHAIRYPIWVYMVNDGAFKSIAQYGQEYRVVGETKHEPIRILFHGAGHYEGLHANHPDMGKQSSQHLRKLVEMLS
mmetsp:Transcript_597/g.2121  ORF Transcript_597/g.2121 Transcript_597/m.2121 type:complete len:276 (+) Transcript_597:203-1030(+)